jgi:periplasmic protein TonB
MNMHKYLLPASIAATIHVALLWLLPEQPHIRTIEVPLVTDKPPIPETVAEPPQEEEPKRDFERDVKPVAGGPTPPEIPEIPVLPDKTDITIPVVERAKHPVRELNTVPKTFGPGDIEAIGEHGPRGPDIFTIGALDRVPRAKVQLPPDYPYAMKQAGTGGSVVVEFDVDNTGHVVRAEAISHTDREFVEPALRAVRKWRFEPGRRNGKAVPFRMTVPIEFGIENN